jgi:hypothetical protein
MNNIDKPYLDSLHAITQIPIYQFPTLNPCGLPQNVYAQHLSDENTCVVLKSSGFRLRLSLKTKENLNTFTWVKG